MAAAVAAAPSSMALRVAIPRSSGTRIRESLRLPTSDAYPSSRFASSSSSSSSSHLCLSRPFRFSSLVVCARRGKKAMPAAQNRTKKKKSMPVDDADEEVMDEDAFEKLFSLLEEDLKNENLSGVDFDDEISEEELEKLERELAAALADDDDDEEEEEGDDGDEDEDDPDFSDVGSEDEDDLGLPKLKNWQLRRLASALKIGRRKTNIKALSAELGLERAVVLQCLRDPPPNLLLVAATLPDKVAAAEVEERLPEPVEEDAPLEPPAPPSDSPAAEGAPVHAMRARWSTSKRLKKVQLETLERVYARTRRPTNAMIGSIVHTTNLPRKTVVKWFEDKRVEDGEPDRRRPFRRSEQGTVFS